MKSLKVGDPLDPKTEVGPLATPAIRDEVHDAVKRTVAAGARLALGGEPQPGKGNFYPPTVLADVPRDSPAANEEIFGPVAALFRVKDASEAIAIANSSRYGLGASAWTNDASERDRLRRGDRVGVGIHQRHGQVGPAAPVRRREEVRLRPRAVGAGHPRVRERQDGLDRLIARRRRRHPHRRHGERC